ncbi:MAG: AAA family ATPase [Pirellulales bacterium]|nr:AAA family ATPase [Pirellulales bacterium]
MYEAFYGLNRRPFAPAPDPTQYFPAESIEAARQNLLRCLQRGEGTGLVIGPSGTGKTLLCQVLAEQLRPALAVVHLCSGRLSSRSAFYQAVLHGLERPYRGMDEGELRLSLVDYLTSGEDPPDGLVLLVDEAHTLPLRLLDEIRMLTNLVSAGESRVRILLAGSPVLEERFASPKLESFSQRLVARCYLQSFNRGETEQYISAQVNAAGGDGARLITSEAAQAAYQATDGVPRLINQLCDHALLLACADGDANVDADKIETAWADLQQLPTPWTADEGTDAGPNIIEFGGLEDDSLPGDEPVADSSASLELMSGDDEPSARVEEIERTLHKLENGPDLNDDGEAFEPVGTIQPEIELDFAEPFMDARLTPERRTIIGKGVIKTFDDEGANAREAGLPNPLAEPFAEEEKIVQRYSDATVAGPMEPMIVNMPTGDRDASPFIGPLEPESPSGGDEGTGIEDDVIIVEEDQGFDDHLSTWSRVVVPRRNKFGRLFSTLERN